MDHTKTDVFRDRVWYSTAVRARLAEARDEQSVEALQEIERGLEPINDQEAGVVVDLFLSYRAVRAWQDMIALTEKMILPLAETVMVREQLALALNRNKQGKRAGRVLLDILERRGPSSETYGILGRVYKDRWEDARRGDQSALARGLLRRAIDAYLKGFETDWHDAYPGVNAVTLMEIAEPPDPRRGELVPVVSYAARRRIEAGEPDYWYHATRLELAVVAKDQQGASDALVDALASVREPPWEPESTARNLRLIREAREGRGEEVGWMLEIEEALDSRT